MALLDADLPVVAAPMAGGPTTPALVCAADSVGAFGILAAGYKSPEAMVEEIAAVRTRARSFGVNLFVPQRDGLDLPAFRAYVDELAPEAAEYGLRLDPEPVTDDDCWREKLEVLRNDPVPVVSLTFGLPDPADIAALRAVGTRVLATVTTPDEAKQAVAAGVDGLIVQGPGAGGHSATFDPARPIRPEPTTETVARVCAAVDLPVVAAGGVDASDAVRSLLVAGAEAVAVGTLLLRSDEAGTSAAHQEALTDPTFTETVITRSFTGRPARALRNGFVDRHEPHAPVGYPAVHHLTRGLRQAAARAHDLHRVHLWAGTGFAHTTAAPAASILRELVREL